MYKSICLFTILLVSCENKAPYKIVFEIPKGFKGVFFVIDKKEKSDNIKKGGDVIIVVPQSGMASTAHYKYFYEWHQEDVKRHDNDADFYLYNIGSNQDKMIYFYGDQKTYESKILPANPLDLRPGKIDY